jgi:MtN3 and saliva related transmembrane protein
LNAGEILGLVAGAFTTFGLIPQVIRILKLRSAQEISLLFTILYLAGGLTWLSYGIIDALLPIIFWNAIAVAITAMLLYAKLKYGRHTPTSSNRVSHVE